MPVVKVDRDTFLEARRGYLETLRDEGADESAMLEAVNIQDCDHLMRLIKKPMYPCMFQQSAPAVAPVERKYSPEDLKRATEEVEAAFKKEIARLSPSKSERELEQKLAASGAPVFLAFRIFHRIPDSEYCRTCGTKKSQHDPKMGNCPAFTTLDELRPGAVFEKLEGEPVFAVKSQYSSPNGTPQCVLLDGGEYAHFSEGGETRVRQVEIPDVKWK
jgi:hypothetical protein